jgi:carbonic anhydrase/acetyltransferase-like protein (isoleucine patch superfamily)
VILPFLGKSPRIDPSAFIAESAMVIGDVEIGPGTSLWFYSVVRGDNTFIRIGSRCVIQEGCVLHVGDEDPTLLEDEVSLAHRVTLHGCRIRKRALIGIGAIVLNGAEVGPESIVGAGSVVAPGSLIPSGTLAIGSPAKPVRSLREKDYELIRHTIEDYQRLKEIYQSCPSGRNPDQKK